MEIEVLRLISDVARFGSFAAAARARDIDPSSVSRIVAQAEHDLGARLFQRNTRRLALTESGEAFVRRIEPVIDEFDRARDEARSVRVTGTLRMTMSVAFGQTCVVPLLPRLRAALPDLGLELVMSDSNLDLLRERIDLAIRLGPSVDGDLICSRLCDTRYRVCASSQYLHRSPPFAKPSDLAAHQALLFPFSDFRTRWLFRSRSGRLTEVPVQGNIVISSALGLRDAAIAGLGPALLPDWLVDPGIAAGRLVDVFPAFRVTATTFDTAAWIVYPSRAFLPAKVRRTIDFLRAELGTSSSRNIASNDGGRRRQ